MKKKKKNSAATAANAATAKIPAHVRRLMQEVEQQANDLLEAIWGNPDPAEDPKLCVVKQCHDLWGFEALMTDDGPNAELVELYYIWMYAIAADIRDNGDAAGLERTNTQPLVDALTKLADTEYCIRRRESYRKPRSDNQRRGSRTKRQDGVRRTKRCDAQAPQGPAVRGSEPKAD
jgi:hypothetical protein